MKKAFIYLMVFMGLQVGVTAVVMLIMRLTGVSGDPSADSLIISMAASSVVAGAVFLIARWGRVSRDYVRSRPWGVLFWCVLASVGMVIPSTWLQEKLPELPDMLGSQFAMILKNRYGYYVVGLLVPVVEELVFRGAILRALLAGFKKHWIAIAVSALLFALVHGNPAQMPHAFIAGMLLGLMYYRTGSIVPGVAYHWVNNTIAYILYNILPDPNVPLIVIFNGDGRAVLASVMFSLCILLPSIYQLNVRMKRADGGKPAVQDISGGV